MAVTPEGIVGIVSNPDARPANDASTLTVPGNFADTRARNITMNVSGRRIVVYPRSINPYSPTGNISNNT